MLVLKWVLLFISIINLQYYLQEVNPFYFTSNFYKETRYLVKRNKAVLNDNIFLGSLGMSKEIDFYSTSQQFSSFASINLYDQYLLIYFALDQEINWYKWIKLTLK